MKKLYRVVLGVGHKAKKDQMKNGYLAFDGVPQTYSRGEAIKKAHAFGGVIELVETGLTKVLQKMSLMAIPENAILDRIVRELEGREMFVDNDLTQAERMFSGDVFGAILDDFGGLEGTPMYPEKKVMEQLAELNQLVDTDYVLITMS